MYNYSINFKLKWNEWIKINNKCIKLYQQIICCYSDGNRQDKKLLLLNPVSKCAVLKKEYHHDIL